MKYIGRILLFSWLTLLLAGCAGTPSATGTTPTVSGAATTGPTVIVQNDNTSASSAPTTTITSTTPSTTQPTPLPKKDGFGPDGKIKQGKGLYGEVKAIDSQTITFLAHNGGDTYIAHTDSHTEYYTGRQETITRDQFKVGNSIVVLGKINTDKTVIATIVYLGNPEAPGGNKNNSGNKKEWPAGRITSVDNNVLMITVNKETKNQQGKQNKNNPAQTMTPGPNQGADQHQSLKVTVPTTATITLDGKPASLLDLKTGYWITGKGEPVGDGSFTASSLTVVSYLEHNIQGIVSGVDPNGFTLGDQTSNTANHPGKTIKIDSGTVIRKVDGGVGSISDLQQGLLVHVIAIEDADNTFTAEAVVLHPGPKPHK